MKILRLYTKKFHHFLFLLFTPPFICIFFLLNLSSRFIKHPNSLFVWWSTPQISISTNLNRYIILTNATNDVLGQMLLKRFVFTYLSLYLLMIRYYIIYIKRNLHMHFTRFWWYVLFMFVTYLTVLKIFSWSLYVFTQ